MYSRLSLQELRKILKSRNLRSQGRKGDLVARLEATDSMTAHGVDPDPVIPPSVEMPELPSAVSFVSLHLGNVMNLPKISKATIHAYALYRQVNDREAAGDNAAMIRGSKMVENNVLALSFAMERQLFFLTGIVAAEMKQTTYNVMIVLSETGHMRNSCCECPAGQGPNSTCKHVVAAILVVPTYIETGQLKIKESCTESLQTFHKPLNASRGNLVRVEDMGKRLTEYDVDPRKECFKRDPFNLPRIQMATVAFCNISV
ncbi:uncharacterized protein LOC131891249 isoform X2 [Tigriopus californicus]|uniref:uncharacterized protein LOC131891237 isoform X2 n=1 Tax=Tigriopus californicus TaxID=6832 RepID=UPI0027DA3191|nr:uncharacterized protein LOC131891237 isoform X2 [Tigriopus californicus]XP_059096773.1 uncharacterized protein LOC131891249 isoform X2 [Tigriopus californicus]